MKKILLLLAGIFTFTATSMAANPKSDFTQENSSKGGSRLRTEWGLTGAAYYNTFKISKAPSGLHAKAQIGYGGGLHMALKIGRFFAVQPEINYQYTTFKVGFDSAKKSHKVKSHTVDIPVLLSLRFGNVFRVNAGPLFTLMNNCFYMDANNEKQMFGNTRPTFGYSAGVAVVLFRGLLIDARYTGYFKSSLNNFDGKEFNSNLNSISLKVGYLF
ncbi:MAG: PorT family protein [Rikenellaceae bacterium]|nr:PorT family protein [Rikenellaceae bacterium]